MRLAAPSAATTASLHRNGAAKGWRRISLGVFATVVSCHTALAGPHDAEISALVDKAVAEWSRVLSCSILDPKSLAIVKKSWSEDRDALILAMTAQKLAPDLAVALAKKTDPETMMAKTKGSVADLAAYCAEDPDWMDRYYQLNITILSLKLKKFGNQ